jgi:hypothetical protein
MIVSVIINMVRKGSNQAQKNQNGRQQQASPASRKQPAAQRKPVTQAKPQPKPQSKPQTVTMSRGDEWEDEEDSWDERDANRNQNPVAPTVQPQEKPLAAARTRDAKPFEAHMHTPAMGAEGEGTEGIDCCHEFMLSDTPVQGADFLPLQKEEASERAKALLQGVIYSEILGRRPVRRYVQKQPKETA